MSKEMKSYFDRLLEKGYIGSERCKLCNNPVLTELGSHMFDLHIEAENNFGFDTGYDPYDAFCCCDESDAFDQCMPDCINPGPFI